MGETISFTVDFSTLVSEMFDGEYPVRATNGERDLFCGSEVNSKYPGVQITFWKDATTQELYCTVNNFRVRKG